MKARSGRRSCFKNSAVSGPHIPSRCGRRVRDSPPTARGGRKGHIAKDFCAKAYGGGNSTKPPWTSQVENVPKEGTGDR